MNCFLCFGAENLRMAISARRATEKEEKKLKKVEKDPFDIYLEILKKPDSKHLNSETKELFDRVIIVEDDPFDLHLSKINGLGT